MTMNDDPFDTGKTRNPNRIDPICEALAERWKESPDLRLGQLVCNLTDPESTFGCPERYVMSRLDVEFDEELWVDKDD